MLSCFSVIILVVSASLALTAPATAQRANLDGLLQRFNEAYLAGNFDKALAEGQQI